MVKVTNMKAAEFERKLNTVDMVCFCAGNGLRELCEVYPMAVRRMRYVVDNYSYGGDIIIDGSEVPVISMSEIKKDIKL